MTRACHVLPPLGFLPFSFPRFSIFSLPFSHYLLPLSRRPHDRRRRRRSRSEDRPCGGGAPTRGQTEDAEAELRRRSRARRRRCLLVIRDEYRSELEQWERLSSALLDLAVAAPSAAATYSTSGASGPSPWELELRVAKDGNPLQPLVDGLIYQEEAQEAVLRKLSDICDYAESLCKEKEESLTQSLIELPIWGSPRTLVNSLQI